MKVGFIGAGHIAQAVSEGWGRAGVPHPPAVVFFDTSPEAAGVAARESGGAIAPSLMDLVATTDLIVVAVRPQHVAGVLADVAPLLGSRPLVSLAAGVTLDGLLRALPGGSKVGRVMPNVAAALGLGVFLFVPGTLAQHAVEVEDLFGLAGVVVAVEESEFDAATAVAGCMPGILAMLVNDFARAGEHRGLEPEVARALAVSGVHGAAAIIAREGDPAAVIVAAATPGGMTAAAIAALEEREIAAAIDLAVEAAARRAKELA